MLSHSTKKPGCGNEIMEYFKNYPETGVTRPEQIAVVGDRLTTDVMMANFMGGYGVWVRDGVIPPEENSLVSLKCFDYGLVVWWNGRLIKGVVCEAGAEICGILAEEGL